MSTQETRSSSPPQSQPSTKGEADAAGSGVSTPAKALPQSDQRPRRQPRYNVVLLDDDHHSYQYVIEMLKALFAYSEERGYELAKEVDNQKRAILLTTTLEHAELKQEQVHAYGPDKAMASSQGSMTVILEPVVES